MSYSDKPLNHFATPVKPNQRKNDANNNLMPLISSPADSYMNIAYVRKIPRTVRTKLSAVTNNETII